MSHQQLKHIPEKPVNLEKLTEWLKADLNVLLVGEFGTGKTSKILEVFQKEFGQNWAFFNGATTDPWTDLIGIPSVDASSDDKVIKYVKPAELSDSVQGIYIDELNRAKTATRNALLELIQFKSINGRPFPNLKVVWASINPPNLEEDNPNTMEYDVEQLDPAQIDRFHIIVKVPNEPDIAYFHSKYKVRGTNLVDWWKQQPEEARRIISPRRLEYVAKLYAADVDISDALPTCANIKMLKKMIDSAPVINKVNELFEKRDKDTKQTNHAKINEEISALLNDENNFEELKDYIVNNSEWRFLKWLKNEEKIDLLFESHRAAVLDYFYQKPENKSRLFKVINRHMQDDEHFQEVMETINNAYKSDVKSTYIRYVDTEEDATDLISKYLANPGAATYYRRQNLDMVLYNLPKTFTDAFADKLLDYLNSYSSKCQVFTLKQDYMKQDKEAAKLLTLSKAYIAYAKEKGVAYKKEGFVDVWAKAEVSI